MNAVEQQTQNPAGAPGFPFAAGVPRAIQGRKSGTDGENMVPLEVSFGR